MAEGGCDPGLEVAEVRAAPGTTAALQLAATPPHFVEQRRVSNSALLAVDSKFNRFGQGILGSRRVLKLEGDHFVGLVAVDKETPHRVTLVLAHAIDGGWRVGADLRAHISTHDASRGIIVIEGFEERRHDNTHIFPILAHVDLVVGHRLDEWRGWRRIRSRLGWRRRRRRNRRRGEHWRRGRHGATAEDGWLGGGSESTAGLERHLVGQRRDRASLVRERKLDLGTIAIAVNSHQELLRALVRAELCRRRRRHTTNRDVQSAESPPPVAAVGLHPSDQLALLLKRRPGGNHESIDSHLVRVCGRLDLPAVPVSIVERWRPRRIARRRRRRRRWWRR
mmetsp:Transcript_26837/g.60656  ORF Transcript_26837/g.60656 Transcript_26837/m.60656 type:complete len:337 (-) Transcript_26837:1318-2328(-)